MLFKIFLIVLPSQATAREATANLPLTEHEMGHQGRGSCVLWWVAVEGCSMVLPLINMYCSMEKSQGAFEKDAGGFMFCVNRPLVE